MATIKNLLVILEVATGLLFMIGVLLPDAESDWVWAAPSAAATPDLGGGYRTRRGLERQIYLTTWVLAAAFLVVSVANAWITKHIAARRSDLRGGQWPPPSCSGACAPPLLTPNAAPRARAAG